MRIITGTGSVTANATDRVIAINKGAGAATAVTLPSSPATGQVVTVKDMKGDSGTNNITVSPATGTIDGGASWVINANYAAKSFIFLGTNWGLVGS